MDTYSTMENAMRLLSAGDHAGAEQACRTVLEEEVDNPDAHYVMGVVELHRKNYGKSEELIRRAIELEGRAYWYYVALAELKSAAGDPDHAIDALKLAISLKPDHPPLYDALARLYRQLGRYDDHVQVWATLVHLLPKDPIVLNNLGNAFLTVKRTREAITAYQRAVEADPTSVDAQAGLAVALSDDGRAEEAFAAAQIASRIAPDDPYVHFTNAVVLIDHKRFDEAIDALEKTLAKDPSHLDARRRLAFALAQIGELDQARKIWLELTRLAPSDPSAYQNLIATGNYLPDISNDELFSAHQQWAQKFADPELATVAPHANTPEPERKLRIAYLSNDLRYHAVAMFLRSILQNHDDDRFATLCLSGSLKVDQMTIALRDLPDDWLVVKSMAANAVAELIRHEAIDILVDLGGHTAQELLQVAALRPAPVQVSYLGYCNTTGMKAMDCVFGDDITDPPDSTQKYVERLIRLPGCFTCYRPVESAPPVNELPAKTNGLITLASFNTLIKINDRVLDLWTRLLNEVPNSRLLFWRDRLTPRAQKRLAAAMSARGIASDRVIMRQDLPSNDPLKLSIYHHADIALDAFPWSGHTTSCHSLWMGVPYVTLRGNNHAGRMAASAITAAGFGQFVAADQDEYVRIVKDLAGDLDALAETRRSMRDKVRSSPLCDAAQFTRNWENALRDAWRTWCAQRRASDALR